MKFIDAVCWLLERLSPTEVSDVFTIRYVNDHFDSIVESLREKGCHLLHPQHLASERVPDGMYISFLLASDLPLLSKLLKGGHTFTRARPLRIVLIDDPRMSDDEKDSETDYFRIFPCQLSSMSMSHAAVSEWNNGVFVSCTCGPRAIKMIKTLIESLEATEATTHRE